MNLPLRVLLVALLALGSAQSAHANGDPASDILIPPEIRVYMTNGARDSSLELKVQATAQAVTDAGRPIKVAIIGNKTDLGAIPQLWGKPQVYAKFLGAELRFVYNATLLIVMPQGLGINGPYPLQRAIVAFAGIDPRKDPSPEGLAATADRALRALAKADGREIPSDDPDGGGRDWRLWLAVGMVITGITGAVFVLRGGQREARAE